MSDALELELRRALADLLDLAPDLDKPPVRVEVSGISRRVPLVPVAAGLVVAVGVGAVVVVDRGGDGGSVGVPVETNDVATTPTVAEATSTPGSPVPTTQASIDRADEVQWFLPTTMPDGYELTDIAATLTIDGRRNPDYGGVEVVRWQDPAMNQQMWVRRGPDRITNADTITIAATAEGRPAATTTAADGPATSENVAGLTELIGTPNTTVHGVDAVIVGPPQRESPGWTVQWSESGMLVTIQVTGGVTEDEAMAVAEATAVTPDGAVVDVASLPEGFEAAELAPDDPPPMGRRESATLVVSSPHSSIRVRIDTTNTSLDALSVDEDERQAIDGVEYSLFSSDDTLYSRVVWINDGRQFEAAGTGGIDNVLAIATGIRPATRDEAAEAADRITATTQALPTVATAELGDGLGVSVHGPADGEEGVVGICIDAPRPRCVRPDGELGQLGVAGLAINAVFHIDGDRRVIAWNGVRPELDGDEPLPTLTAAATGTGWFVDRLVPAGEPLRGIDYRADDGSLVGVYPIDVLRP